MIQWCFPKGIVSVEKSQLIPAWWILSLIMSEKVLQSSAATFFLVEFRFSSCLFVETSRIQSVSRESVRFEAKWSKVLGQIVGNRAWQELLELRLKWEQIGSWTSTWNHPSVIFKSCFRCNGSFHISEMELCSTHWLWPDICYSYVALWHGNQTSW